MDSLCSLHNCMINYIFSFFFFFFINKGFIFGTKTSACDPSLILISSHRMLLRRHIWWVSRALRTWDSCIWYTPWLPVYHHKLHISCNRSYIELLDNTTITAIYVLNHHISWPHHYLSQLDNFKNLYFNDIHTYNSTTNIFITSIDL